MNVKRWNNLFSGHLVITLAIDIVYVRLHTSVSPTMSKILSSVYELRANVTTNDLESPSIGFNS